MPESTEGPTVLRILLGTQLRRLRESRGISAQAAAKAIRGSESKISRIELGRNAIREIDVLDLLTFYGVGAVEREQLLTLAEQANRPGWWHRFNDILPDWFQSYVGMEEAATSIRVYEPQFIPGLLQTRPTPPPCWRSATYPRARRSGMSSCARNGSAGSPRDGSSCGPSSRKPHCGGRSASAEILRDQLRYLLSLAAGRTSPCRSSRCGMGGHAVPSGFTCCGSASRTCPTWPTWNTSPALSTSTRNPRSTVTCWPWSGSASRRQTQRDTEHHRPRSSDQLEELVDEHPWRNAGLRQLPGTATSTPRRPERLGDGRSNSPFFAPIRKHSHSCRLKKCGVLLRSLESRTATPPSGRCAISTHPAALLALLLNQRRPARSVSIRLSFHEFLRIFPNTSQSGELARYLLDQLDRRSRG